MENIKILNKKESNLIINQIKGHFGIDEIKLDYGILKNKEGKFYLISKIINQIDINKLRINELGLYIARFDKELRLTMEGSQLFGKYATRNVYEINREEANSWMQGNDLKCDKAFNGFVIIRYRNDYLGCGKCKDNKILNYIPKERRVK